MIRVSKSLDRGQAQQFVGPDLAANCFQQLSASDTGRQRVKLHETLSALGVHIMCTIYYHSLQLLCT